MPGEGQTQALHDVRRASTGVGIHGQTWENCVGIHTVSRQKASGRQVEVSVLVVVKVEVMMELRCLEHLGRFSAEHEHLPSTVCISITSVFRVVCHKINHTQSHAACREPNASTCAEDAAPEVSDKKL